MPRYTEEELITLLHAYVDEFGELPTPAKLDAVDTYPSARCYSKRFGNWLNALYAAELKTQLNDSYFSNMNSLEKWYYVGFLIGDGSITQSPDNTYKRLAVGLNAQDEVWLETFKNKLNSSNVISYDVKRNAKIFAITSAQIVNDLSKFNIIPRKSWNCSLLISYLDTSTKASAFLLGLLVIHSSIICRYTSSMSRH
jgi:hypothetical protein